jgi:hypothetical protein
MNMRARACSASNPCAAFYEWMKKDPLTVQSTNPAQTPSLRFPCKYNTARLVKNFESSNHCGLTKFQTFGPLEHGEGWCGVVSSSAEYPTLRDADDRSDHSRSSSTPIP